MSELCLSALRRARSDNDRLAALLLIGRQLGELAPEEKRQVFSEVDLDFVRRLLAGGSSAEAKEQRSLGLSVLGQLAEADADGLLGRQRLPALLSELCECLSSCQRAGDAELTSQSCRVAYALIDGADSPAALADSPLLPTLCRCAAAQRLPEWENCARLAVALVGRCAEAQRPAESVLKSAAGLLESLVARIVAHLPAPQPQGESLTGKSQAGESHDGNSHNGKSQAGESHDGNSKIEESRDGKPQDGKSQTGESHGGNPQTGESHTGNSQTGKSQGGDSQTAEGVDEELLVSLLELAASLLGHSLPGGSGEEAPGQLAAGLKRLGGLLPRVLGHPPLKAASLDIAAKIVDAYGFGLFAGCYPESSDAEFCYLLASIAALELELRLQLADTPADAFCTVLNQRQHRQLLTACFILIEESLRGLAAGQLALCQRPQLAADLLARVNSSVGRLADCLASLPASDAWRQMLSDSAARLFLVACLRCCCLWLCETAELRQRLSSSSSTTTTSSDELSRAGQLLRLFSQLVALEPVRRLGFVQFTLPYLCLVAELPNAGRLLSDAEYQPLMLHLFGDYLAECVDDEAEPGRLVGLANVLLNVTLGSLSDASWRPCCPPQRLAEASALIGRRWRQAAWPEARLAALVLGLSCLRLALDGGLADAADCCVLDAGVRCIAEGVVVVQDGRPALEPALADARDSVEDFLTLLLHLVAELLAEHSQSLLPRLPAVGPRLDDIRRLAGALGAEGGGQADGDAGLDAVVVREYQRFVQILDCIG